MRTLEEVMQDTAAKQAEYKKQVTVVENIKDNIRTAASPLAPAVDVLTTDATAFNSVCDEIAEVAVASKVPIPTPPAPIEL